MRYDDAKGRVVADRPIKDRGRAMFSFGEDEKGEVYLLTSALDGKGDLLVCEMTRPRPKIRFAG